MPSCTPRSRRTVALLLAAAASALVATTAPSDTSPLLEASGHGWSGHTLAGPVFTAGSCHTHIESGLPLPDIGCTPGVIDTAVTQATIATTICTAGYTATVRPPTSVTTRAKRLSAAAYGITTGEYDHLVPLELGGASDTRNLWVEPGAIPNAKDRVENTLHRLVCAGTVTLTAAQKAIATDWTTALATVGPH
jgi:hypothetical protein